MRHSHRRVWRHFLARELVCFHVNTMSRHVHQCATVTMGWLRLVGSLQLKVSFAKEPYKTDDILQKRPICKVTSRASMNDGDYRVAKTH